VKHKPLVAIADVSATGTLSRNAFSTVGNAAVSAASSN
jgi:hypothetical protein